MADFAAIIRAAATELLGGPSTRLSTKTVLRFGKKGSVAVDLEKGTWFDHEAGRGGGTIDLVMMVQNLDKAGALAWLAERGLIEDSERGAGGRRTNGGGRNGGGEYAGDDEPPWQDDEPPAAGEAPGEEDDEAGWTRVAVYDYRDAAGKPVLRVERWQAADGAKRFVQRTPDGQGGWRKGARRVRHVPYRLAELSEAIRDGSLVFVVEGEKCADALAELGVPATTHAGGAGKWPGELSEYFAGADVVILPDNDPQAKRRDGSLIFHANGLPRIPGWDQAKLVGAALAPVARSVRILKLPDLPLKGDVFDWLAAGGTVEKLYDLVRAHAFAWTPDLDWRSSFHALPWPRMDEPGAEHEWLVKGIITRHDRSMLVGPSRSGKSFLALALALAVARGEEFFGHRTRRGLVVYQAGEGRLGLKKRIRAYRDFHRLTPEDNVPFVLLPARIDLYGDDKAADALIAECEHWQRAYAPLPLELIVIDTYSAATPGANENASEDVSRVLARCDRIGGALGAHVMLVHHMNAGGTKPRGHTSIFADLDSVISCYQRDGLSDDGEVVTRADGTSFNRRRPIREAEITKQKDGEDGETIRFVLKSVTVGLDEDREPVTSCVVVPPYRRVEHGAAEMPEIEERLPVQAQNFMRAIYRALEDHGIPAPAALRLPPGVRVVEWSHVRTAFEAMSFEGDDEPADEAARKRRGEAVKKAMARYGADLHAKLIIGRERPYVWLTGRKVRGFRSGGAVVAASAPGAELPPAGDDDAELPW